MIVIAKKTLTKICAMLCCLAMLMCCIVVTPPQEASAATVQDSGTYEGKISWTLYDDGTLKIEGEGSIGATLGWKYPWRKYKKQVISLKVCDGITALNCAAAFKGFKSLTSVSLPNTLKKITQRVFAKCTSLSTIKIPNSVTSVALKAFANCSSLKSVTLPKNLKGVDRSSFEGCKALTSITVPSCVKAIDIYGFKNCKKLKSVDLAKGLETISKEAFSGCSSLKSISIPSTTKLVGWNAFKGCTSLKKVTVADAIGLTKIEKDAFSGCSALKDIYYAGSKAQWQEYFGTVRIGKAKVHFGSTYPKKVHHQVIKLHKGKVAAKKGKKKTFKIKVSGAKTKLAVNGRSLKAHSRLTVKAKSKKQLIIKVNQKTRRGVHKVKVWAKQSKKYAESNVATVKVKIK